MAAKTKRISTLIESQLPEFISTEYELFGKFVQKYYEAQEFQGGPLDIITNIQKYADIDFYEQNLLKQNDILAVSISDTDTTIVLEDASSFPEKNGYVRIDDEVIFYASRTDTDLLDCSRGISGNTTLGDLYSESDFKSTTATSHVSGKKVYNVSNLFLYAFVKNFENQYLGSFPEKYLKGEVDKRTLIKNIQKFYKAKGTESSIKFIFNTILAKDINNKPSVYNPRDFTYKSSESDWINVYALKVKVISGDPKDLIGSQIVQTPTEEYGYASATVDNVYPDGTLDGEKIWNIVLSPETVNGSFSISTKTRLEKVLPDSYTKGKRVDVFSTIGWDPIGSILINDETIWFDEKNVTQFVISKRGTLPVTHAVGSSVYKPVTISGSSATLLTLGVVYNLLPDNSQPYSDPGDKIQVSNPGFETSDVKIVKTGTNQPRWIFNSGAAVNSPTNPTVQSSLDQVSTNVSAIFADDQYYYVTSSSFPSYKIFDGSTIQEEVQDQKLLRIIRKQATRTTEIYQTPKRDVGILLNGVPIYSFRDQQSIRYGKLEKIDVNTQGRGYEKQPFVLVDGLPNKARAILSGQFVDRIVVDTTDIFPQTPEIKITSGEGASARAIVTGGSVTSLVIDNPGRFYSSPPLVEIRDRAGRGRFANYRSIVDTDGRITGFEQIDGGSFYTQENVTVNIIPVGSGASGIPQLKEWNYNRFTKLASKLDDQYGYVFQNYNNILEYGYGHVGNPKALRISLNDNLNIADTEPTIKTHSPILGFAYDGNPIYGPFAHENPLDSQSPIVRMTSSYSLTGSRDGGPSTTRYSLGTFVNDYVYNHKSGSLDQNNGRFCVTPDYPQGTYAYFLTINSNQNPIFPYFVGENFYSLPVDSNYNSDINQNDIPKKSKRYYLSGMPRNGEGLIASISEVKSGFVDGVTVERSSNNFSVNSKIYFDNTGTEGSDAKAIISSVKGKSVNYLESKEDKVVKLTTIQNAYLFANDTLRQPASGASGKIVGTVQNDNVIVLRQVSGTFNNSGTFSADIKTFILLIDQDSSYTKGAILSLTDGINPPIATGEVLEGTSGQNIISIKVLTGTWVVDDNYFLQSNNLFNTSGSRIITLTSLSDNLEPFDVNQRVALIETDGEHGLGIGDKVNIDINPDDTTKTKTYFLRKRLYQTVKFATPKNSSSIEDTGIGRYQILNGGADYTPGVYSNVPLTGGSGTGATAIVTVSSTGVVSSVQLQDKGSGYKKGDYLGVDDESLVRSLASLSTARFTIYVDHVGFASGSSSLNLKTSIGFSIGDLLKIGNEIVEISSINDNTVTVIRGIENTDDVDHFDGQKVDLYKAGYNFTSNFQISASQNSGFIESYNQETQEAIIVFNYSAEKLTADKLNISTTFFDSSLPQRLVKVNESSGVDYKFEFSEDNTTFIPNPIINLQEFYTYKFDTSHSSLTGTYFDLSPSNGYNLSTVEKLESTILPGNPGAFTSVKFGFGARLVSNNYQEKVGTSFSNFYYFDKNLVVNSGGSYFKIISDPLQGTKTLSYVTPTRFVYDLTSEPLWDGSGDISYTTTGQFAIGEVNSVRMVNLGLNYKKVPVILGCDPNENYRASATVLFDYTTNIITGIQIDNKGSNYVNPKIVIVDGDGDDAKFNVVARNGEIFSITVDNPGRGYTYAPTIEIVEGDVEAYVESNTIGVPLSVSIVRNGGAFHLDETVSSKYTTNYTVSLSNFTGDFQRGETVTQTINGVEVFRAKVSGWRFGSNLLKLEDILGTIRQGVVLKGAISRTEGVVKSVYVTEFKNNITSFYDNLGYYTSDKGRLGVSNQRLTDSFFYQDYSYVVKSKTPIEQWRDLIKSTTHPAGFKLFGQVDVESSGTTKMPDTTPDQKASTFTIVQLWDPEKNKITVENTRRTVTQIVQKIENTRIKRGIGSAATSEFNFNETRAFTFTLAAPFDGYYNSDGRLQGTTIFQVLDDKGSPFTPISEESLVITLDGILQEPKVAYTVESDKIIFSQPPLGPGAKLTGNNSSDVTTYNGVTFYGKCFYFRESQYNNRYLRKIRNIFQRNGRWIDASNQIERNSQFIIEESIGYTKDKYPNLPWNTRLEGYKELVKYFIDAYQHDIRFGGNSKTVDYASIFKTSREFDFALRTKSETLDMLKYATNLSSLSVRNWDVVELGVLYLIGSDKITVSDTDKLCVGMYVSSGRSFPPETKIISIDSKTQVTVSKQALANSGGGGGVPDSITDLSGSTGGSDLILPTSIGSVSPGNLFSVDPGDILQVLRSFSSSDSATFYLSGINSGIFYDASNLILKNKAYLQEEISEYIYDTYTLPSTDKDKCARDLGYLIDAVVYHLRFGGNRKVVEFAQLYYTNVGYPYGEELTYINRTQEETTAATDAWSKLKEKMILAMRNQLGAGTYTSIAPFIDNTISLDIESPVCAEVGSAIAGLISIVEDIISKGTGVVEITEINSNKSGFWTNTLTYSNYNLIPDPLLLDQECDDVTSSVTSLYENINDVVNSISVIRTTPDYIDGETKVFEMYWENGDPVITEEDEDLFLTINAVLQKPKYNEFYPGGDAYYIDRTVIPNQIVFDVAPIWDQDFGAKNIGEPTAVEKIVGIGVGNYKRLTIDTNLVDGTRSGPFLILDLEDLTVENIEEPDYMFVFIDGVLQRENYSYTVSGPNIYFTTPLVKENKVDIRYLYGRDVGQILRVYDFQPDGFYAKSIISLEVASGLSDFLSYKWIGGDFGRPIHVFQFNQDGTFNMIGSGRNFRSSGSTLIFECFGNKSEIIPNTDVYFALSGKYTTVNTSVSITTGIIDYETDEDGKTILENNEFWNGTFFKWRYRNPFINISDGDQIRVEGQDKFRRIKQIPRKATTKEERPQNQVSSTYYSAVEIERYNGISRGEGLSVVAIIENGVVVDLEWNQRSYNPITQPTAYQYFTPPVLHFIPKDGNGGGARANVLVSKGQVISVDLIDGGSGYTEAPQVIVARRYDVIEDRDIGVSVINAGLNLEINQFNMVSSSTIGVIIGNQVPGINTFISTIFDSPIDSDRVITSIVELIRENNNLELVGREFLNTTIPELDEIQVLDVFLNTPEYISIISGRVEDVISTSIVTTGRQITTSVSHEIDNTALSNINYYETGAYIEVDLDITDNIIYIPDTSKFKTNGYLLVGNEIVRYYRKLTDRFLSVQRGQTNTTAQFWPAGTFLRQIPDPVSVAFGGVSIIESDSVAVTMTVVGAADISLSGRENRLQILTNASITTVNRENVEIVQIPFSVDSVIDTNFEKVTKFEKPFDIIPSASLIQGETRVVATLQTVTSEFTIQREKLEVLIIPPLSGVIDRYVIDRYNERGDTVYIADQVQTRLNGFVDLLDDYGVVQRSGDIIFVENPIFPKDLEYIGNYTIGNVGHTISHFDGIFDDGFANVSGISILELSTYYPYLTIRDFAERGNSSYTLYGDNFILMPPSIQNPVTITSSSGTIGSSIVVQSTEYFPDSGYVFTSGGTLIQYTSKTATTFDGCSLVNGADSITSGQELIPYSIS